MTEKFAECNPYTFIRIDELENARLKHRTYKILPSITGQAQELGISAVLEKT